MRPTQTDLLATLRTSLNDTLLPKIEDRWARYVANAMDLVLQHLQLRLAGESDTLAEDSADMAHTLAEVVQRAATAAAADESVADRWTGLAELVPAATSVGASLAEATERNERLRAAVVDVMRWLDQNEDAVDAVAVTELRESVHQMIRRQTDRLTALVTPLFMSFGPVAS
jgi:hypothetical protein